MGTSPAGPAGYPPVSGAAPPVHGVVHGPGAVDGKAEYQQAAAPPPPAGGGAVAIPVPPGAGGDGPEPPCACCSAGWILFALGFIFPILWIVGASLPCCSKSRKDRHAAIASGIAFATFITIILLFAVILPLSLGWYQDDKLHRLATSWHSE